MYVGNFKIKFTFLFILISFAVHADIELDMPNCDGSQYCNAGEIYRPAFIFGAGQNGINQLRQSIYQNRELVSAVLEHELNTENETGLASQYILPIANKSFPITDSIPLNQGPQEVRIPGLGFVLDPNNFNMQNTDAIVESIDFTENNGFSGVNLNNFRLSGLTVDFSEFRNGNENPRALVCSHIGMDVNTSFAINMENQGNQTAIGINDLDLQIDSTKSSRICFNIEIDFGNFQVKSIERLNNDPILTREQIDDALRSPNLSYDLPQSSPLSSLPTDRLKETIAQYVGPVFASPEISGKIETPIIESVQNILSSQVNDYMRALFESNAHGTFELPPLNLPNNMLASTLNNHLEGANELMNESKSCRNIYRRVNNLIYWSLQNDHFRDASVAQAMNELSSRVENYPRCRNYRDISDRLTLLSQRATHITPKQSEAEALIMHQLAQLEDGELSVEVFIPELCNGTYNAALLGGSELAPCEQFHSMMDISYINNFLSSQRDKGNLCQIHQNGMCGFRIMDHSDSEEDDDTTPTFGCEDIASVDLRMMENGKLRATANLNNCQAAGKSILITSLGSFENTNFQIVFDVELKTDCPNGQKACFDLDFNEDLLTYSGRLESNWFEGSVREEIIKNLSETEENFERTFNDFPINNMLQGLDVDRFFGEPVAGSPGYFGVCLEVNQENETANRFCELARLRLPRGHNALANCP
tara:strand:+ start:53393 stop:55510 length:2118 start_codon:yes stop_codon:yes gene_type:complete